MKEQGQKIFPYKNILEYLTREETSLATIKSFFRSTEEGEVKGLQSINTFTREMVAIAKKVNVPEITKAITNFSIHSYESQHIPENIEMLSKKFPFWLEQISERYRVLRQQARMMETRKRTLSLEDINRYKAELTKEMIGITHSRESLVNFFCYIKLKNNSQYLERLTNVLRKYNDSVLKRDEKKQAPQ